MELYIFDSGLNFIGLIDHFTSLQWIRRYAVCGEFELHCLLSAETLALLSKGNIIWKKGDSEAGVISYRQLAQDTEGKETLIAKGKFLSVYLGRRIVWGQALLQSTAEVGMRALVTGQAISPADSNRVIPNLILGSLHGYTPAVNYQTSYSNLQEEIEKLCGLSELGYRIRFNAANKQILFEVYEGVDRTPEQNANSRAIFSQEFENILGQNYTDSISNYRNLALVGGMGEGSARKLVTIGSASGLNRIETFVDAKDLTNVVNEVTISDVAYLATLADRGNTKLADFQEVQTFDSTVNLTANLIYKTDFDLGDMVACVSKKWGITLNSRITEITEIYEESGQSINVTFGNNIPTLLSVIKNILK